MRTFVLGVLLACGNASEKRDITPLADPSAGTGPPLTADPQGRTVITSAEALATHDGDTVVVAGTYRTKMSAKGMPRPGQKQEMVDLGYAAVEVPGPDGVVSIDIGAEPRPAAERESLAGHRVEVSGKLVMSPPTGKAAATRPRPRLVDVTGVKATP